MDDASALTVPQTAPPTMPHVPITTPPPSMMRGDMSGSYGSYGSWYQVMDWMAHLRCIAKAMHLPSKRQLKLKRNASWFKMCIVYKYCPCVSAATVWRVWQLPEPVEPVQSILPSQLSPFNYVVIHSHVFSPPKAAAVRNLSQCQKWEIKCTNLLWCF